MSAVSHKKFDVLLAGYYGFGNLGDELLASSAVDYLVSCGIKRERIAILSGNPEESRKSLGIEAFGRGLLSSSLSCALSASRSMIFAGGGIFQDSSSLGSCFYYWYLTRRALLASCRVAAVSQSVGPLFSRMAVRMTKDAIGRCSYHSVRDESSLAVLRSLGLDSVLSPDLVMGMSVPRVVSRDSGVVLINIRPVKNNPACAANILKAAHACVRKGLSIRGVAFAGEDKHEMEKFISSGELPPCGIVQVKKLEDFVSASEGASMAIGMRLHFGILSLLRGLGLAMVPYDPKVSDFAGKWDVQCPEFEGISSYSDIMKLLTDSVFKDKKQPDHDEAVRDLSSAFKMLLRRVLEVGKNG
jgi:polysaccharide pyruvyl transferase CsaB